MSPPIKLRSETPGVLSLKRPRKKKLSSSSRKTL